MLLAMNVKSLQHQVTHKTIGGTSFSCHHTQVCSQVQPPCAAQSWEQTWQAHQGHWETPYCFPDIVTALDMHLQVG